MHWWCIHPQLRLQGKITSEHWSLKWFKSYQRRGKYYCNHCWLKKERKDKTIRRVSSLHGLIWFWGFSCRHVNPQLFRKMRTTKRTTKQLLNLKTETYLYIPLIDGKVKKRENYFKNLCALMQKTCTVCIFGYAQHYFSGVEVNNKHYSRLMLIGIALFRLHAQGEESVWRTTDNINFTDVEQFLSGKCPSTWLAWHMLS